MSLSQFTQEYITIATDISASGDGKVMAWAFYIRHSGGAIKRSGVFKETPADTCRAETFALCNALVVASQLPQWSRARVVIHNEIERVLTPLRTKKGKLAVREIDRTEAILKIALPLLEKAKGWERRKIKAHYRDWKNSDNPAKYAINRWCDTESRRVMREERKKRNKEKNMLVLSLEKEYNR